MTFFRLGQFIYNVRANRPFFDPLPTSLFYELYYRPLPSPHCTNVIYEWPLVGIGNGLFTTKEDIVNLIPRHQTLVSFFPNEWL